LLNAVLMVKLDDVNILVKVKSDRSEQLRRDDDISIAMEELPCRCGGGGRDY
jgi:hypothetical protein